MNIQLVLVFISALEIINLDVQVKTNSIQKGAEQILYWAEMYKQMTHTRPNQV